ncbi:NADH dehydrogenase ubiquinone 1 beta subcomplex subunit 7 [Porphyridium purpureum]|uniref:NADH dehydrogenase [ubiquinone] 1 beta subcomplex subunit 7 n=1 Tax=Porphyridium purpureum TaxID=35688 RepID=A0A5J4Z836_PORPP|nr:NADH dehydrogenase ubiquinone 1 beta subcomplex subunit 7 [Porphyridium purpureum]|eukprot:POR6624..scf295_1
MIATKEEMRRAHVPLAWRDNCAHLLIPLNECRWDTWWNPNKCMPERKAYMTCQDTEYERRVRVATKRKKEEYWRQQNEKAAADTHVSSDMPVPNQEAS